MTLPLQGITILDFSTLLPGPLATFMLAEAGAEVIKVEKPGGEDMRRFPPALGGESAPFAVLNGGKKSIEVDLKTESGRLSLVPLLQRADVVVEQFRPGVMQRLGLDYEAVRSLNPRVIYCSITGYGQEGPRADQAGHDLNYQAVTGLLSLSPGLPASLVADIAGGAMPAVMNILLALRQRDLTGAGSFLDIGMADAMFTFSWFALAQGHATGRFPGAGQNMLAGGSPRYDLYETSDGQHLALGALEPKFWDAFCTAINLAPSLRDDARDPAATRSAIRATIGGRTGRHWRDLLEPLDCCCTVVVSLEDARRDEHFRARGLFAVDAAAGDARIPAVVVPIVPGFREASAKVRPMAKSGEHTRAVLGSQIRDP
jgi:crotonobetainyl-CoA:carnitine CoA-transferase CaiB-like acyl-CoA transferase